VKILLFVQTIINYNNDVKRVKKDISNTPINEEYKDGYINILDYVYQLYNILYKC